MRAKPVVRGLLKRLPDACTVEEFQYHLYVLQAIERGRSEIEAGRGIPHEKVVQRLREKWRKRPGR